jgi:hypothetical protein
MGSVGPGTLLTVVLAIVGPVNGVTLAALTVSPSNVVGTAPTRSINRERVAESEVSRIGEVSSTIAARRSRRSAIEVPSGYNLPNSRLPPAPRAPLDRMDIGHAAKRSSSGSSPRPCR